MAMYGTPLAAHHCCNASHGATTSPTQTAQKLEIAAGTWNSRRIGGEAEEILARLCGGEGKLALHVQRLGHYHVLVGILNVQLEALRA